MTTAWNSPDPASHGATRRAGAGSSARTALGEAQPACSSQPHRHGQGGLDVVGVGPEMMALGLTLAWLAGKAHGAAETRRGSQELPGDKGDGWGWPLF